MASPFQTPVNEKSFSSLIDEVIVETGAPASLLAIVQFANLTVRECQAVGLFARDLVEDVVATNVSPYIWTRPARFRILRTAWYQMQDVYPKFLKTGKQVQSQTSYYYAADDYFVFSGVLTDENIGVAYYTWLKSLVYSARFNTLSSALPGGPYATRAAYYDVEADVWQYLNVAEDAYVTTLGDTTEEALRRANATNWLLDDWRELIISGTKAKVWSRAGDNERAGREFAAYKATQNMMRTTIGREAEGF